MKSTESWTWTKTPKIWGEWHSSIGNKGLLIRHLHALPTNGWMADYRKKIQAIDTDEKAQAAIYSYWQDIAEQWSAHIKHRNA